MKNIVYLHRINPEKGEARFYWLKIGASLVDPCAVLRIWGRIGGFQRVMVTPFRSEKDARKLFKRLLRRRLRSGYTIVTRDEEMQ